MPNNPSELRKLPFDKLMEFDGSPLAEPIRQFCLAVDTIFCTAAFLKNDKLTPEMDGGLVLHMGKTDISVRLPLMPFIRAAVLNTAEPRVVAQLTNTPSQNPPDAPVNPGNVTIRGNMVRFQALLNNAATGPFVVFYESYAPYMMQKASNTVSRLEPIWGFARVVRNALVHGNTISINDNKFAPVSWQNVTIGRANNGEELLGLHLQGPDLIILLIDMNSALIRLGHHRPVA
jgi:hypothetical protein